MALQLLRAIEEMLIKGATHNLIVRTRPEVAPGIGALVTARQVLTPLDLERDSTASQAGIRCIGEPSLDHRFAWRRPLGWARYRCRSTASICAARERIPGAA